MHFYKGSWGPSGRSDRARRGRLAPAPGHGVPKCCVPGASGYGLSASWGTPTSGPEQLPVREQVGGRPRSLGARLRSKRTVLATLLLATCTAACGGGGPTAPKVDHQKYWSALGLTEHEKGFDAELGGIGRVPVDWVPVPGRDYHPHFPPPLPYNPIEWTTHTPSPSIANLNAPKGGTLRIATQSWFPTLRTQGPNSRLEQLFWIQSLVYEPLLTFDLTKGVYVPRLADSWKILPDKKTFLFHINPEARWADGRPVTADDVKATLEHLQNPDRKDPYFPEWQKRFASAKVLDEHTVEIRSEKALWQNFLMIATQQIYPAAYIRMDGSTYLHDWNWKLPPGSGPYAVAPKDLVQQVSITLHRRKDWWAKNEAWGRGKYNFDRIEWLVIRDRELMYQKLLAGEIDLYQVRMAQRWVQVLPAERKVRNGWIQMRKLYTKNPRGFGGYAFNMRSAPFNDRNVRLAFCYLFNRKKLFGKFLFDQYDYTDSYYPGEPWARPGHHPIHYDPAKAVSLLKEAGWTHRDAEGYLVNASGERFPTLRLDNYDGPGFARLFQVYQHDLWNQAGVKLEIHDIEAAEFFKKVLDYQFRTTFFLWTASPFPDPQSNWSSTIADKPQSNNIVGFKNPEVDAIIDRYDHEFDQHKRVKLLQASTASSTMRTPMRSVGTGLSSASSTGTSSATRRSTRLVSATCSTRTTSASTS